MGLWDEVEKAKTRLASVSTRRHHVENQNAADVSGSHELMPYDDAAEHSLGSLNQPETGETRIPLSDQEREDIAAGLTPAQARRAAEARVDTLEWLLGLETLTQEQTQRVASFRRMDAALISARGKMPYLDTLGIPRFPPDCEPKYRHWAGGQPLLDTLLELRAQDWAIDSRVTREGSPDDWQRWQEIKAKRRK
jgi:hypothetical protein